ncbi:hypothetical protein ACIBQ5_07485 [Streptomyces massasporeus]|uniref:hypothetical protein n=1 Tax=Streptomyces massasporeus TaxID=67324 RepID=UPI0037B5158A
MFRIDVVSEPGLALNPGGYRWDADLKELGRYDVSLVKPALLFADKVELVTFRMDLQAFVMADAFKNQNMPMRFVGQYAGISMRRDPEELEILGLSEADLSSLEDAEVYLSKNGDPYVDMRDFAERHEEGIYRFRLGMAALLRDRHKNLINDGIELAVKQGVLECSAWHPEPPKPHILSWSDVQDEFPSEAAYALVGRLAETQGVPMLDPGAQTSISHFLNSETLIQLTGENEGVRHPFAVSASLMTHLPGFEELEVSEVLDLRKELAPYLPAFRGEMVSLSEEIGAEVAVDSVMLAKEIERRWHKDLAPVLQEIQMEVGKARYSRNLLAAFSSDKAAMASTATSVMLAAGSVFAGAASLIPAAAAAAFPFVAALNETLKSRDDVRKNRLYFLHGVTRRISKG